MPNSGRSIALPIKDWKSSLITYPTQQEFNSALCRELVKLDFQVLIGLGVPQFGQMWIYKILTQ